MATLYDPIMAMIDLGEASILGAKNAITTNSYYVRIKSKDGREITLRDSDHLGYGQWNGVGKTPIPKLTIHLTRGRRLRLALACRELAKWIGLPDPKYYDLKTKRGLCEYGKSL